MYRISTAQHLLDISILISRKLLNVTVPNWSHFLSTKPPSVFPIFINICHPPVTQTTNLEDDPGCYFSVNPNYNLSSSLPGLILCLSHVYPPSSTTSPVLYYDPSVSHLQFYLSRSPCPLFHSPSVHLPHHCSNLPNVQMWSCCALDWNVSVAPRCLHILMLTTAPALHLPSTPTFTEHGTSHCPLIVPPRFLRTSLRTTAFPA